MDDSRMDDSRMDDSRMDDFILMDNSPKDGDLVNGALFEIDGKIYFLRNPMFLIGEYIGYDNFIFPTRDTKCLWDRIILPLDYHLMSSLNRFLRNSIFEIPTDEKPKIRDKQTDFPMTEPADSRQFFEVKPGITILPSGKPLKPAPDLVGLIYSYLSPPSGCGYEHIRSYEIKEKEKYSLVEWRCRPTVIYDIQTSYYNSEITINSADILPSKKIYCIKCGCSATKHVDPHCEPNCRCDSCFNGCQYSKPSQNNGFNTLKFWGCCPIEVQLMIIMFLTNEEYIILSQVCKFFRTLRKDNKVFETKLNKDLSKGWYAFPPFIEQKLRTPACLPPVNYLSDDTTIPGFEKNWRPTLGCGCHMCRPPSVYEGATQGEYTKYISGVNFTFDSETSYRCCPCDECSLDFVIMDETDVYGSSYEKICSYQISHGLYELLEPWSYSSIPIYRKNFIELFGQFD